MKSIFITRQLGPDSIFATQLIAAGASVRGESLLTLSAEGFDFESVPEFTYLFFYSKNGVSFFLNQLRPEQLPIDLTIGAIGSETLAFARQELSTFSPQGHFSYLDAEAFINNLKATLNPQGVLFPLAKVSEKSLHSQIPSRHHIIDLNVYSNQPKTGNLNIEADILVFTSPMNVQTYIQHHADWGSHIVIAIGQTTARALQQAGCTDFLTASSPNETSLAQTVLSVINS